jgi:nuclear pore complex protein Nup155
LRFAFLERARVAGHHSEIANAALVAASDLERELRPLSDMFNDFARPAEMWEICLEMLHFSRYRDTEGDGAVARALWDELLSSSATNGVREGSKRVALRSACAATKALGPKLFPSDTAFPVAHVALKLELLAAGLWRLEGGEGGGGGNNAAFTSNDAETGEDDVAECVLASTRESFESVHAAYDRLLATPAHRGHHDRTVQRESHLQTPALRLRLLRSALRVLRRWEASLVALSTQNANAFAETAGGGFGSYGGGKERTRAALADVCSGYAGEARRLLQVPTSAQGTAEALAADFEALGRRLAA